MEKRKYIERAESTGDMQVPEEPSSVGSLDFNESGHHDSAGEITATSTEISIGQR